jgi:hypothetical protein
LSGKSFLFQINVTRDCNLRCTHCYISTEKKNSSKTISKKQLIDLSTNIVNFLINDKKTKNEYDSAEIHIIGGEPTMLGLEYFKEVLPEINRIFSASPSKIKLSLVTNMVTNQSVDIAMLFDAVSTSFEYDTRFVSKSGKPKPALEQKWLSNIKKVQDLGREVFVTTAITKQVVQRGAIELLDYFYKNKLRKIHMGFFIPGGDGLTNMNAIFPTFKETSLFMINATEWYLKRRMIDIELYVNPIESMIESIYYNKPMDDIVCPIIPGSLDIDWNGETVTCIEAGGELNADSLGNAFNIPIIDITSSRKYIRERTSAIITKPNCIGCDEYASCQSACGVLHQYWNGEGECPGFKSFIKHIRNEVELNGLKPKSLILREMSVK